MIVLETPYGRRHLPNACQAGSKVVVLKLHGCFGWRQIAEEFFLEGEEFLDVFGFQCAGQAVQLRDEKQPEHYQPSDPVAAFPSYLKPLSHPLLVQVWRTASSALAAASRVVAVGYSLPQADSGVRALLLPLAERVQRDEVTVEVFDRSRETLQRWVDFLGPRTITHEGPIESA